MVLRLMRSSLSISNFRGQMCMKKAVIRILCFLLILTGVLWGTNRILQFKYDDGIYSVTKFYEQEDNTVDVLILGSSHAYQSFNTGVLWEDYGLASYVLSGSAQPMWNTYYYLKEALKTQSPKLIVLEGYMTIDEEEYSKDEYIIKNTYGLKWTKDKIDAITISAPQERRSEFLLEYIQYHNRYSSLSDADFLKNQGNPMYEAWKGFSGNMSINVSENPDTSGVEKREALSDKTELYYRKTIELAQEQDIPILVVISPYAGITKKDAAYFNAAQDIAGEYDVPFVNCNLFYQDLGIDFVTDAADSSHLNSTGNVKFSTFVGEYIAEHYDIPDRRGDTRYQSWQDDADYIQELTQNQKLTQADDINSFAEEMQDAHYLYFVSVDGYCTTGDENIAVLLDALRIANHNEAGLWYTDSNGVVWYCGNEQGELYLEIDGQDIGIQRIYDESSYCYESVVSVGDARIDCRKVTNGVNIVVYNTMTKSVVDSVGFDADDSYHLVR
jgi:hypothetical protein